MDEQVKRYFKMQVEFQMRDFIERIIKSYLEYLRDQDIDLPEYLAIESTLKGLTNWLYLTMKG